MRFLFCSIIGWLPLKCQILQRVPVQFYSTTREACPCGQKDGYTGLVAYLTRYSSPEILMNGAINGAILENYTVAEIIKTYHNCAKECILHYYRDKDSNEIDLVIESDGELHPLEIKKTVNPGTELVSAFKVLDKASVPRGVGAILCMRQELSAIDRSAFVVPIWMI